jgi:hypothetical protein
MSVAARMPTPALALEDPATVRVGTKVQLCGGTTYRALKHAFAAAQRATTVRALAVAVWGPAHGPHASRGAVKGVLHRANCVLVRLGVRERLTLDGNAVLLV